MNIRCVLNIVACVSLFVVTIWPMETVTEVHKPRIKATHEDLAKFAVSHFNLDLFEEAMCAIEQDVDEKRTPFDVSDLLNHIAETVKDYKTSSAGWYIVYAIYLCGGAYSAHYLYSNLKNNLGILFNEETKYNDKVVTLSKTAFSGVGAANGLVTIFPVWDDFMHILEDRKTGTHNQILTKMARRLANPKFEIHIEKLNATAQQLLSDFSTP